MKLFVDVRYTLIRLTFSGLMVEFMNVGTYGCAIDVTFKIKQNLIKLK